MCAVSRVSCLTFPYINPAALRVRRPPKEEIARGTHSHTLTLTLYTLFDTACVSVTATCKKRAVAESSCHRLCVSHEHICSRSSGAASRTPARAIGEGRVARPRATDQQLVGVGQGVCRLPSRTGGHAMPGEVRVKRQEGHGRRRHKQRAGVGSTADWGQGTERNARRTLSSCL